jgi:hypothetical protein
MRIEINYQAETLEMAICEAIVTYLGYGMPACEISPSVSPCVRSGRNDAPIHELAAPLKSC